MSSSNEPQATLQKPGKRTHTARLMRNTPIGTKMAVVVGAMIVPLLALLAIYAMNQWSDIRFVRNELDGLAYFLPLEEIGGALNGRSAKIATSIAAGVAIDTVGADAEIEKLLSEMDVLDKKYGQEGSQAIWRDIHAGWTKLKASSFKDVHASLVAHSQVSSKLDDMRMYIATEWGMALDPIAESYYMLDVAVNKVPELESGVGSLRGLLGASLHGAAQSAEIRLQMIRNAAIIEHWRISRRSMRAGLIASTIGPIRSVSWPAKARPNALTTRSWSRRATRCQKR
jgi:methyl-accepting chemotaxis protein